MLIGNSEGGGNLERLPRASSDISAVNQGLQALEF